MNNALFAGLDIEESSLSSQSHLQEREGKLVRLVDAVRDLESTSAWSTLKTELFDNLVENLERRVLQETRKVPLNDPVLYQLEGQLLWARKYANLRTLADSYVLELTNVRTKIKPPDGAGQGS